MNFRFGLFLSKTPLNYNKNVYGFVYGYQAKIKRIFWIVKCAFINLVLYGVNKVFALRKHNQSDPSPSKITHPAAPSHGIYTYTR